ncbi:MAG: group II intron reverse transcriptase/maturase [Candidatus Brocadiaceae bacterium]|nr:group II intron reverse transcriptase/maturase [Candidatus Brocadiaceae bacterium]
MGNDYSKIAYLSKHYDRVQTIMHHINSEALINEHKNQKSKKAPGIDGIRKEDYGKALKENVDILIKRMKAFSYKPKPVRRTYIPKGDGKTRPLGIPSYEDKLVQGVMRKVLDAIYEGKFMDFSFGFRRGKNCHKAIREVNQIIMTKKVNFVVDVDIKGFFNNVNQEWLLKFLAHDIEDKNFMRYIVRILKSGMMEELKYYESDKGTPQGGLISPVLANVYLHYVLDIWFEKGIKKHFKGEAQIVRYADDFVCFFQYENEANLFLRLLKERLAKFSLEVSEEKTKLIPFGRFAKANSPTGRTEGFDFLGFAHYNGETRTGRYRVIHRTSKKKLKLKKKAVKDWMRDNMHGKLSETIKLLNRKIVGHYAYYGISGNYEGLCKFYKFIEIQLYKTLKRRSQRQWITYIRYKKILDKFPIMKPKLYVNIWSM